MLKLEFKSKIIANLIKGNQVQSYLYKAYLAFNQLSSLSMLMMGGKQWDSLTYLRLGIFD